MAQFTLTHQEAIDLIRKQFMLPTSVEIKIGDQEAQTTEREWINVPSDHIERVAPEIAQQYGCIEVMYGSGECDTGAPDDWNLFWGQTGDRRCNIVKFRPVW